MKNTTYHIFALFLAGLLLSVWIAWMLPLMTNKSDDIVADNEDPDQSPDANEPDTPEATPPNDTPPSEEAPPVDAPAQDPEPIVDVASYIRAKVDGLQLRSGPGTEHSAIGHINEGDMVTFVGSEGNWYRTKYKNRTAYISAVQDYTELYEMEKNPSDAVEDVIEEGLRLLGFPYVYGAIRYHDGYGKKLSNFDATKYDCSSLVQYIFYRGAAVNLQMTTRTQVKQGIFVSRSKIQRGDLIFFTNAQRYNNTGIERIGHVALYLGNNYILHTASDYAVIEEISAQRWRYYIETRRVV